VALKGFFSHLISQTNFAVRQINDPFQIVPPRDCINRNMF